MACDLETTQAAACESGIGKVGSPISLLQLIAQLSCEIADAGGGGGTPSAPLNSVQFNNAGAFGGSADLTFDDATNLLSVAGAVVGPIGSAAAPTFRFGSTNTGWFSFALDADISLTFAGVRRLAIGSSFVAILNDTSGYYMGAALDTSIDRQAAGVVQVTDHLWADTLRTTTAFTVGGGTGLPAAGQAGRRAFVTDALGPAFGATVVGGGAVVVPVFDDGANWIVG